MQEAKSCFAYVVKFGDFLTDTLYIVCIKGQTQLHISGTDNPFV